MVLRTTTRTLYGEPVEPPRPLCKVHCAAVVVVHFATWAGGSEWLPKLFRRITFRPLSRKWQTAFVAGKAVAGLLGAASSSRGPANAAMAHLTLRIYAQAELGLTCLHEKASAVTTNAPPGQAERLLQVQPRPSFLGGVAEPAFNEPKANELTWGRHTYSGIVVQVIKAHSPFQLTNPAAPSRYGSGWDNLESFPGTGSSPMLKLFSISF